jgi:hypothetical protein
MNKTVDEMLTTLEEVSAKVVDATDITQRDTLDASLTIPLIEKRGALIAELNNVLRTSEPLSYSEWNRLVIVHYQGNRIQANLLGLRSQAVVALADNARAQAFIERLTGAVGERRKEQVSETA